MRKSYIEIGEVFSWTATINNLQKLLREDKYKDGIISSLEFLSNAGNIDVFAFGFFFEIFVHEFGKMLLKEGGKQIIILQSRCREQES